MAAGNGFDLHEDASAGRQYCIRFLRGVLELSFPGQAVGTVSAPSAIGPLVLLALNPRRALPLEAFKSQLYDYDAVNVTTAQIQTPISRLRHAGLPIALRSYLLDVAPSDVDVVDLTCGPDSSSTSARIPGGWRTAR